MDKLCHRRVRLPRPSAASPRQYVSTAIDNLSVVDPRAQPPASLKLAPTVNAVDVIASACATFRYSAKPRKAMAQAAAASEIDVASAGRIRLGRIRREALLRPRTRRRARAQGESGRTGIFWSIPGWYPHAWKKSGQLRSRRSKPSRCGSNGSMFTTSAGSRFHPPQNVSAEYACVRAKPKFANRHEAASWRLRNNLEIFNASSAKVASMWCGRILTRCGISASAPRLPQWPGSRHRLDTRILARICSG